MDLKNKSQFTETGKVFPQAVDIEESVLGTIMLYPNSMTVCIQYLKPESFYKNSNQEIYKACIQLFELNKNIDCLTVGQKLKSNNKLEEIGDVFYLNQLTSNVNHSQAINIEFHCQIIAEKYIKRELIRISIEVINKSYNETDDTQDIIDYSGIEILKLTENIALDTVSKISDLIRVKVEEIEKIATGKIKLIGVPSGLTTIDRITSGWQQTDLIILAARPSVGKTAFALKLAKEAAIFNFPTIFFSLEMSSGQLATRLISSECDNTQMELRKGIVSDWVKIEKTVTKFQNIPLYIDDKANLSISQLKSRLIIYKQKFGIKMAIIDYLQLISGTGSEKIREQVVSNIARSLKICAKELNIPIIALSQLNRSVESRTNKKPVLSDLRESGAIEQDADMVIFLSREEMYNLDLEFKGKMQIDFAKHRNGSTNEIQVLHNEGMTDFFDENITMSKNIDGNIWYENEKNDEPF